MTVTFTVRQRYLHGNNHRHQVDKRFGGPQSRFGHWGEQKNLFASPGIEPEFLCSPSRSLVSIPTEIFRLYVKDDSNSCSMFISVLFAEWNEPRRQCFRSLSTPNICSRGSQLIERTIQAWSALKCMSLGLNNLSSEAPDIPDDSGHV
jgi:hypothetical protein